MFRSIFDNLQLQVIQLLKITNLWRFTTMLKQKNKLGMCAAYSMLDSPSGYMRLHLTTTGVVLV